MTGEAALVAPASGAWFTASPFAPARAWIGGKTYSLPRRAPLDTYFSAHGTLKVNDVASVWHPWD
jgi:hypothetical protein